MANSPLPFTQKSTVNFPKLPMTVYQSLFLLLFKHIPDKKEKMFAWAHSSGDKAHGDEKAWQQRQLTA